MLEYLGYKGSIDYSEEDKCWFGQIQNVRGFYYYEGSTKESCFEDFKEAVDKLREDINPKAGA